MAARDDSRDHKFKTKLTSARIPSRQNSDQRGNSISGESCFKAGRGAKRLRSPDQKRWEVGGKETANSKMGAVVSMRLSGEKLMRRPAALYLSGGFSWAEGEKWGGRAVYRKTIERKAQSREGGNKGGGQ